MSIQKGKERKNPFRHPIYAPPPPPKPPPVFPPKPPPPKLSNDRLGAPCTKAPIGPVTRSALTLPRSSVMTVNSTGSPSCCDEYFNVGYKWCVRHNQSITHLFKNLGDYVPLGNESHRSEWRFDAQRRLRCHHRGQ